MRIRLLGAPATGKTQLAAELANALPAEKHPALAFTIDDNPAPPFHTQHPTMCATFLMGLDLPVVPASADLQQAADRALRDALAQSSVGYQVVYGEGAGRLRSALGALEAWLRGSGIAAQGGASRERWVWSCDNCSDPQCERRLLSDLLAARAT